MGTWIEARPKLIIPGVINSNEDECHMTMAYLGDVDPEKVCDMMADKGGKGYNTGEWPTFGPMICEVSGTAAWRDINNDLYRVALVQPAAELRTPGTIYGERERIILKLNAFSGSGDYPEIKVDTTYPFVPHITLPDCWQDGERVKRKLPEIPARIMFVIDAFYVSYKDDVKFTHIKI